MWDCRFTGRRKLARFSTNALAASRWSSARPVWAWCAASMSSVHIGGSGIPTDRRRSPAGIRTQGRLHEICQAREPVMSFLLPD